MTLSGLLAALGAERSFANIRAQAGLPPGERSAETVISVPNGRSMAHSPAPDDGLPKGASVSCVRLGPSTDAA